MAWRAATNPRRAIVYEGVEPARRPGESFTDWLTRPNAGAIYRSRAFCEQAGKSRLLAAGVGGATVTVAALGSALLLRRP